MLEFINLHSSMNERKKNKLKREIKKQIRQYFQLNSSEDVFIPGKTLIKYAGPFYDDKELNAMVDVMLKGWFGLGHQGELLEKELAEYVGAKHSFLVNSGSSADLLAVSALMSYQFTTPLMEGDEVITPAFTFPSVVAALVHKKLKPVFVDNNLETLNPRPEDIDKAITKKTKMIFLVHTLGNPNDMDAIMKIARDNNLMVLEDNSDGLGSMYNGKKTGSFGIMAVESFYPAHHITTAGEGGAVFINDIRLKRIVQSLRDWGRACWCGASGGGKNGLCKVRFNFRIGDTPYDHKYIFSHVGYNLKPVEIQAAMGRVQLKKLDEFIRVRKKNFSYYLQYFKQYEKYFILPKPMIKSDPSWFAFPITIRKDAPFNRVTLTRFLEDHQIQTRPLFAGNILRQPGYKNIQYRAAGKLKNSDFVFTNSFFIGVYPRIANVHLEYVSSVLNDFLNKYT